jgi:lipopolysaccharide transport system ATP-binding protein
MKPAIRIENLSKRYRINSLHAGGYRTLRETIMEVVAAPWRGQRQRAAETGDALADTIWALRDVSLEIEPGEVVGIIGRNGAGKTTLLKVLSRVTEPTSGRIEIRGRLGSLLEVGTGFHLELTGRENIFLNGAILGMTRSEIVRKFDEIVAFSEVERFLDTPVKRYSSGMKVRLAFAVAAHLEPHILLLDEVLAVGDTAFQRKCLEKTREIALSGRTVLLVSHNMATVLQICKHAIFLEQGRLIAQGPAAEVAQRYLSMQTETQQEWFDLTTCRRGRTHERHAELTSCRATTGDKTDAWSWPYGSELAFDIVVQVRSSLSYLELGVTLFTATGSALGSALSHDCVPPAPVRPGRVVFNIAYPGLTLQPGRYYLAFSLRCDHGMVDYIPEAVYFDVLPTMESAKKGAQGRLGPLIPAFRCSVAPLDGDLPD